MPGEQEPGCSEPPALLGPATGGPGAQARRAGAPGALAVSTVRLPLSAVTSPCSCARSAPAASALRATTSTRAQKEDTVSFVEMMDCGRARSTAAIHIQACRPMAAHASARAERAWALRPTNPPHPPTSAMPQAATPMVARASSSSARRNRASPRRALPGRCGSAGPPGEPSLRLSMNCGGGGESAPALEAPPTLRRRRRRRRQRPQQRQQAAARGTRMKRAKMVRAMPPNTIPGIIGGISSCGRGGRGRCGGHAAGERRRWLGRT